MNVLPGEKIAANVGRETTLQSSVQILQSFQSLLRGKEEKASTSDARIFFLLRISFNCEHRVTGQGQFSEVVCKDGGQW